MLLKWSWSCLVLLDPALPCSVLPCSGVVYSDSTRCSPPKSPRLRLGLMLFFSRLPFNTNRPYHRFQRTQRIRKQDLRVNLPFPLSLLSPPLYPSAVFLFYSPPSTALGFGLSSLIPPKDTLPSFFFVSTTCFDSSPVFCFFLDGLPLSSVIPRLLSFFFSSKPAILRPLVPSHVASLLRLSSSFCYARFSTIGVLAPLSPRIVVTQYE